MSKGYEKNVIKIIRNSFANTIESMSITEKKIFNDERFTNWIVTALINMLVDLYRTYGTKKDILINLIDQIWEQKERKFN